jgi:multiple antibiotic resistance protein
MERAISAVPWCNRARQAEGEEVITPLFIFTVFMLTLGPIKTVPAFFAATQNQAPASARSLALQATLVATGVCIVIVVVMRGIAASWRVSPDDLRIAGGILLFAASRQMIEQFGRPASPPQSATPPQHPAVTPLAIPIIITPWGVAATLFFADLVYDDLKMSAIVVGILVLVMLLNLVGMLLARQIIAWVGIISFQVLGWIFAVLQAAFAVDAVVTSLRNLALFHPVA